MDRDPTPWHLRLESRKLHGEKPPDGPYQPYIIGVPKVGRFLSHLLPLCVASWHDEAFFYAIVDDFGNLVAVK